MANMKHSKAMGVTTRFHSVHLLHDMPANHKPKHTQCRGGKVGHRVDQTRGHARTQVGMVHSLRKGV